MQRYGIWATALALVLSACGGGDGSGSGGSQGSLKDTVAPDVSITASSTKVVGGGAVAITATAKDDVDGAITPQISCSNGALMSGNLATPIVATTVDMTCTADATDKAGNNMRKSVMITLIPSSAVTVQIPQDFASVVPMQAGAVETVGLALTSDKYTGRIGTKEVQFARATGSQLAYMTPDLPAGNYRISVDIDGTTYSSAVKIGAPVVASNPKQLVSDTLADAKASIAAEMATLPSTDTIARGQLQSHLDSVNDSLGKVDSLSQAEIQTAAGMILANEAYIQKRSQDAADDACFSLRVDLDNRAKIINAAVISLVAVSTYGCLIDQIKVACVATAAGIVGLINFNFHGVASLKERLTNACLTHILDTMRQVGGQSSQAIAGASFKPLSLVSQATSGTLAFQSKTPKTFSIVRTRTADDANAAKLDATLSRIKELATNVSFLATSIKSDVLSLSSSVETDVSAQGYTTVGITNPKVIGSSSTSGGNLVLAFELPAGATSQEAFQFTLVDPEKKVSTAVSATVAPTLPVPEVADASLRLRQDQTVDGTLTAKNGTSSRVVTPPGHGTVTFTSPAAFTFKPASGYFGTDSFTYASSNSSGESKIATVTVTIQRDYAGEWIITYGETITTGAQNCGAEGFRMPFTITRQSDTAYSVVVAGNTVVLTQASATDPNGLKAETTITYPEDGGTTTSQIKINIPTPTSLNGTSVWSWRSSKYSCSGTGFFSGVRSGG